MARARPVLWTFQNTRVVSSGGIAGTLLGRWATFAETDQTPAGAAVMYPGTLSSRGARFSTYLHAAS